MHKTSFISIVISLVLVLTGCGEQVATTTPNTNRGGGTALKKLLEDSSKPAVVKFYAEWCKSCKAYAPVFKKVEQALAPLVDFYEVDIDESKHKALMRELKIARIPETVFVSQDRSSVFKRLGSITEKDLTRLVNNLRAE